jgi:hypothetical protein
MIFGLSTFTVIHVVITLVAIASGLAVLWGLLGNRRMDTMTGIYLVFTALTSITGFFFPFHGVTPAITLGVISCAVFVPTLAARYAFALRGTWRWIYAIGAVALLYFNVFVLVVQLFLKVPALHALAPTGSEPPFAVAQGVVLLFFVVTGFLAARRFRPRPS